MRYRSILLIGGSGFIGKSIAARLADAGYRVVVRRYAHTIRLLHPVGHDYYHMLREKLHWTEFY